MIFADDACAEFDAVRDVRHASAAAVRAGGDFLIAFLRQLSRPVDDGGDAQQRNRLRVPVPTPVDRTVVGHGQNIVTLRVVGFHNLRQRVQPVADGAVRVEVGFVSAPRVPVDRLVRVGDLIVFATLDIARCGCRGTERQRQRSRQHDG